MGPNLEGRGCTDCFGAGKNSPKKQITQNHGTTRTGMGACKINTLLLLPASGSALAAAHNCSSIPNKTLRSALGIVSWAGQQRSWNGQLDHPLLPLLGDGHPLEPLGGIPAKLWVRNFSSHCRISAGLKILSRNHTPKKPVLSFSETLKNFCG